jgi:hypothetical protein
VSRDHASIAPVSRLTFQTNRFHQYGVQSEKARTRTLRKVEASAVSCSNFVPLPYLGSLLDLIYATISPSVGDYTWIGGRRVLYLVSLRKEGSTVGLL